MIEAMLSRLRYLSGFFLKFLPAAFLIIFYFLFFGLGSVERFLEESIVTHRKSLQISSAGLEVNPGLVWHYNAYIVSQVDFIGLAIIPMDPQTGNGWKSSNFSHLSNLTTTELKKGLEDLAYKYEEIGQDYNNNFPFVCHSGLFISSNSKAQKRTFYLIVHMPLLPSLMFLSLVLKTRHPVSHFPLLANGRSGLVHVLEGSSLASAQKIILNETLSYYLIFFDPTFSVISPNPIIIVIIVIIVISVSSKIWLSLKNGDCYFSALIPGSGYPSETILSYQATVEKSSQAAISTR